jgi:filamentous hemagglutinin
LIATAILGGAAGNVTGGVSEFARASAVNYLQGLTTQQVKLYADTLGDGAEAQAARAALHTVVGCAAGTARGDGCGASALGAGAASVVNALLDAASGKSGSALSPEDKEARVNLVSSLLAGVAVGLGADAAAVVNSGKLETENNSLGTLIKRGGMAGLSVCFRSPACYETVLAPAQYSAITALAANLVATTPGLQDDQALLLAVIKFISGEVPESLPGRPGEPIPPVGVPPGGGVGGLPDTQLPGKSGEAPDVGGVPGQENNGPAGGSTTTTPLPEEQGAGLIFNQQEITTSIGQILVDGKIGGQFAERGWTQADVQAVVNAGAVGVSMDNRSSSKTPDGPPRNDTASVYGSKNEYIVVNDRTGEIVQISNRNNPDWIPGGRIKWM